MILEKKNLERARFSLSRLKQNMEFVALVVLNRYQKINSAKVIFLLIR